MLELYPLVLLAFLLEPNFLWYGARVLRIIRFFIFTTFSPYFSGAVKLQSRLTSSAPDSFNLLVRATDGHGLNSDTMANVTIIVVQDSAQSPLFSRQLYQFSVEENSAPRLELGSVSASVQGKLSYPGL